MADNINLRQTKDVGEGQKISYADEACYIRGLPDLAIEDNNFFNVKFPILYGMPYNWASGEAGMKMYGDSGLTIFPDILPGDYRVTMRSPQIPVYEYTYGDVHRLRSKYTDLYDHNRFTHPNPNEIKAKHLASLSKAIPNYLQWIIYKTFAGEEFKKKDHYIKEGGDYYIEPSDGATNGYKFMLSEGYDVVNYSQLVEKKKITENKISKRLDEINKALRDEKRKLEVEINNLPALKMGGTKDEIPPRSLKTIALFYNACKLAEDAIMLGRMDKKYKHKDDADNHFKGKTPSITAGKGLVCLFPQEDGRNLEGDGGLTAPSEGKSIITTSRFPGEFILTPLMDSGECIVMQRDLLQYGIMPEYVRYTPVAYPGDAGGSMDYIFEIAHTLSLLEIYCSAGIKLKAS